ncbi:MAG: lipoprotein, partial [Oscillospiraceae bacterium]|nr:lipoprotein [Oscillospiraceae bacterium]
MRKIIAFLVALALLTGCADVVDLRMRLVVHAIGVDIEEGEILCVSFQTFTGEDIRSDAPIDVNRSNITTFNVYGRTIQEARENLVLQTGKDVIISDTEIIVLGESFLERDISNILTYFWDDSDVYMGTDIAFANGTAKDIIGRGLDYGVATSELLTKIIYATTMDCTTVSSRAVEVYNYLCEKGGACVLPVLTLAKNSESSDDEQSLIYGTVAGVERNLLVVNRVPLAYLTLDETRGINILRGSDQKLALVLDAGGVPVSVNVHLNGTQRKAEIENGHAVITVGILGDVSITDNPF